MVKPPLVFWHGGAEVHSPRALEAVDKPLLLCHYFLLVSLFWKSDSRNFHSTFLQTIVKVPDKSVMGSVIFITVTSHYYPYIAITKDMDADALLTLEVHANQLSLPVSSEAYFE